jgi:hypothetical protein
MQTGAVKTGDAEVRCNAGGSVVEGGKVIEQRTAGVIE